MARDLRRQYPDAISPDFRNSHGPLVRKQRILSRPTLEELFDGCDRENLEYRNQKVSEAFHLYGYKQSEVADFLKLHRTMISRIVNNT